ncbi:hypothetical protein PI124_g20316 [Phytophthora idaei]|nr:hypothetical protein PI124_g20316 [Phytophthora idaei]
MVKLLLTYAIVGLAEGDGVEIDDGLPVWKLKDAIREKEKSKDRVIRELQPFLAKTSDGAWLRDEDPSVLELEEGRIHPDVQTLIDGEKMKVRWTINDVLKENHMPTPQSRQVHVLVVVPEGAGGSASETSKMDQLVEKVDKMYEQTVLGKRKVYRHPSASSTLLTELNHYR